MRLLFRLLNLAFLGTFLVSCDGLGSPSAAYDAFARPFEGTFAYVGCEGNGVNCTANDAAWADSSIVIEKFEGVFVIDEVMSELEANQLFIGENYYGSPEGSVTDYYLINVLGPDIGGPYLFHSIMGSLAFYPYGEDVNSPADLNLRMYFLQRKFTKEKRVDLGFIDSNSRLVFMSKG